MVQKTFSVMGVLKGLEKAKITPNIGKVIATIEMLQGAIENVTELVNSGCYDEADKRQEAVNEVQNTLIEAQCKMCGVLGVEIQNSLIE